MSILYSITRKSGEAVLYQPKKEQKHPLQQTTKGYPSAHKSVGTLGLMTLKHDERISTVLTVQNTYSMTASIMHLGPDMEILM